MSYRRQIGGKWDTAWRWRQRLASVIAEVEAKRAFEDRIEIDGAVMSFDEMEEKAARSR